MDENTTEATPQTPGNPPALIAYSVENNKSGTGHWSRIGAAWPTAKGNGYTLQLRAIPVDGRVVLIEPKEEPSIQESER